MAAATTDRDNKVLAWDLQPATSVTESALLDIGPGAVSGTETAFSDDARKIVPPESIRKGGKYYSIVKLQIEYEGGPGVANGTGWLIANDLLVTAGHCGFDHTYRLGKAKKVKAWVGYNGKKSVTADPVNVQFRHGIRVVTPYGWVTSDANRQNDVSLIKLASPFEDVVPYSLAATQERGQGATLGVVGYPADKFGEDKEMAAQMYEQFNANVAWNLKNTTLNMLEYTVSTFGGQSGSPVLVRTGAHDSVVGVHVYGYGFVNAASVIRGTYGNYLEALKNTINGTGPISADPIQIPSTLASAAEDAIVLPPPSEAESFWDTLKDVVHVGSNIASTALSIGTPFLGPVGAPIAAIAGTALGIASKMTESALSGVPTPTDPLPTRQLACRAIAAEGALQTVLGMKVEKLQALGILPKMQAAYKKNKGVVTALAPVIGPALLDPALRAAVAATLPPPATTVFPKVVVTPPSEAAMGDDGIVQEIARATQKAPVAANEEGFFDFITGVVSVATKVAPPLIGAVGDIINNFGKGESALQPVPVDDELLPHFEAVCHRSVLGEAALDALASLEPKDRPEGFFTPMVGAIKKIGQFVVKVAPGVIRTVGPIIADQLQKQQGQGGAGGGKGGGESGFADETLAEALNDSKLTQAPQGRTAPQAVNGEVKKTTNGISNGMTLRAAATGPLLQTFAVNVLPKQMDGLVFS